MMLFASLLVSLPVLGNSWQRGFQRPERYDVVPVVQVDVETNDEMLYAVTRFPNACYEPLNKFKEVEGNRITLYSVATYPQDSACPRVVEYQEVTYTLEDLRPGKYEIIDGDDGGTVARIEKHGSTVERLD